MLVRSVTHGGISRTQINNYGLVSILYFCFCIFRPDTVGYLNKLEDERRKKEKAANEPQSFFGKYVSFDELLNSICFLIYT